MSDVRTLADKLKAAPSASNTLGRSVLLTDSNGKLNKADVAQFSRTAKMRIGDGEVVRISNLESAFISCRGTMSGRCLLVWVSIYGSGTINRLTLEKIYGGATYKLYVNGSSENACIYVAVNTSNTDYVAVTSLFGETPIIEKVSALPSDAFQITFD